MSFLMQLIGVFSCQIVALTLSLFVMCFLIYNLLMSKLQNNPIIIKTEKLLKERLPSFAGYYFKSNRDIMTDSSLYAYALDLSQFFDYISKTTSVSVAEFNIKDFESITESQIENYMEYSRIVKVNGKERNISNSALRRRFAILHAFYNFYYVEGMINTLPTLRVSKPREMKKAPTIPSHDAINALIDYVTNGELPSKRQAAYQEQLRERDAAIIILLCCAGLKTTECTNLNITDLHFDEHYINISGRKYPHIKVSSYIEQAVSKYLAIRLDMIPVYEHDNALFLSISGTRICQRALQYMIKKYCTALFGKDNTIVAQNLCFSFKNQVYNSTKSVSVTSRLSGNHPMTIESIYEADLNERQSDATTLLY